jgi:hypothetical protein
LGEALEVVGFARADVQMSTSGCKDLSAMSTRLNSGEVSLFLGEEVILVLLSCMAGEISSSTKVFSTNRACRTLTPMSGRVKANVTTACKLAMYILSLIEREMFPRVSVPEVIEESLKAWGSETTRYRWT